MAKDKLIERMTRLEKLLKEFLDSVDRIRKENVLAKDIENFTLEENQRFLQKFYSDQAKEESMRGYG